MNRRQFITMAAGTAGTALVAGCSSKASKQSTEESLGTPAPGEETPSQDLQKAAVELEHRASEKGLQNVEVLLPPTGNQVLLRFTTEENPRLGFEFAALAYAETLQKHDALGLLTVRTGGVQAYVPKQTAVKYNTGDIKEDAYLETLEIREVEATKTATPE